MKYILKNDLSKLKKVVIMSCIFYVIPLITYLLSNLLLGRVIDENFLLGIYSLNINFKTSIWLEIIIYMLNFLIYIYIAYLLFTSDLENSVDNIFLRMKRKNWIEYKLTSILLVTFIYTIMRLLLFILISYIFDYNVINIIIYIIYQCLYLYLFQLLFIIFLVLIPAQITNIISIILLLLSQFILPTSIFNIRISTTILFIVSAYLILIILYIRNSNLVLEGRSES